ncbi:MAG: hypothetical protein M3O46_05900 [Myxococcota bacterium]|nr:hypothetical protein [Myxococcota bacterium]
MNEPTPFEFEGQSWWGSGAALAAALAVALASVLVEAIAVGAADALATGFWTLVSSLEQPKEPRAITSVTSVRIEISSRTDATKHSRPLVRPWLRA